ncbi:MAG: cytochrome P460 family protein [Rhizobiaceae bacterium]|nr:cytochrome P460 family protein [Rhizobiaceae bacterium]
MGKFRLERILALAMGALLFTQAQAGSDDPFKQVEHFKIERPANLDASNAMDVYDNIIDQMAQGYAQSGYKSAKDYSNWRRDNNAPYLSAGHGNRFLNNYGNKISSGYLKLRRGQKMPAGSVLAKDSFTVTDDGEIFAGALFIMEKLAEGTSPDTGNWRYAMIMPDGSLFGDSAVKGDNSMQFCQDCHNLAKTRDYLFLIPWKFRPSSQ